MPTLKAVVLIVRVIMPGETPDITHVQRMESVQTCMEAAGDYMGHELTDELREKGAIGLGAMCAFQERPSEKN